MCLSATRRNIGVVFCGRQAPGGHDVIAGLKTHAADWAHEVVGFVGGVEGLVAGHVIHVTDDLAAAYRGQGGFDLLGRSSDRIAPESYEKITAVLKLHAIQRLVLIGAYRPAPFYRSFPFRFGCKYSSILLILEFSAVKLIET